jgi:hypothetical protein
VEHGSIEDRDGTDHDRVASHDAHGGSADHGAHGRDHNAPEGEPAHIVAEAAASEVHDAQSAAHAEDHHAASAAASDMHAPAVAHGDEATHH